MLEESNRRTWLVLIGVLFGHVLLVALPVGRGTLVRTMILDILTPAERLADFSIEGVSSLWRNYIGLVGARHENERLRAELSELRMELQRNRAEVLEAERLRHMLELEPLVSGHRIVARVVGGDTTPARRTVTIDKGRRHGIELHTPVMTSEGIVGRVIQTGHFSSIVQLISDPESAVGVIVRPSRVQGIVRGNGTPYLELEHVDDHTELLPGDDLVTSGTDQIYPKGLPVGIVAELGQVRDFMKTAWIEPAVDLGKLEEVLCVIAEAGTPESVEDPDELTSGIVIGSPRFQ